MKRAGGLHPARPDCWPPTKRPLATPRGLIAGRLMNVSRREAVPPCVRTSPLFGRTLRIHRTSWRIPLPRHAMGFEMLGCQMHRLQSKRSADLRMQPYPPSPGHIWPGDLHGTGCLSTRAMDTGFCTVASCARLGWGLSLSRLSWLGLVLCVLRFQFLPFLHHSWQGPAGCARGYRFCLYFAFPGWVLWCARLPTGTWWAYVGKGSGPAPPVLAGACGPCVGMGLVITSSAFSGFVGPAFCCGSLLYPGIPGLRSWRVVRCGFVRGAPLVAGLPSFVVGGPWPFLWGACVAVVLRPPWV